MDKVLLTVEEAAERLSIGRTKAFELVAKGELESVTVGRCRRVPVQALELFVAGLLENRNDAHPSATMADRRSRATPVEQVTAQPEPTPESQLLLQ